LDRVWNFEISYNYFWDSKNISLLLILNIQKLFLKKFRKRNTFMHEKINQSKIRSVKIKKNKMPKVKKSKSSCQIVKLPKVNYFGNFLPNLNYKSDTLPQCQKWWFIHWTYSSIYVTSYSSKCLKNFLMQHSIVSHAQKYH